MTDTTRTFLKAVFKFDAAEDKAAYIKDKINKIKVNKIKKIQKIIRVLFCRSILDILQAPRKHQESTSFKLVQQAKQDTQIRNTIQETFKLNKQKLASLLKTKNFPALLANIITAIDLDAAQTATSKTQLAKLSYYIRNTKYEKQDQKERNQYIKENIETLDKQNTFSIRVIGDKKIIANKVLL